LEATNHIGGRIRQQNFSGINIEVGANWVEGVNGPQLNPIWDMANKIRLRSFQSDYSNLSANTYKQGYIVFSILEYLSIYSVYFILE
jgi:polyamine oxidase